MERDAQLDIPSPPQVTQSSQSHDVAENFNSAGVSETQQDSERIDTTHPMQKDPNGYAINKRTVKRQRTGKKSAVTRRVNVLHKMVNSRESRTRITFIRDELCKAVEAAAQCHERYMSLLDEEDMDFSDEWIEDLRMKVDLCISKVQEYLDERAHEPPSDISSLHCSNWLSSGSISGSVNSKDELLSITDYDDQESIAADKEIESLSAMFTDALQPWSHRQSQQNILQIKDELADQENVMVRDLHVPVSEPAFDDTSITPPVSASMLQMSTEVQGAPTHIPLTNHPISRFENMIDSTNIEEAKVKQLPTYVHQTGPPMVVRKRISLGSSAPPLESKTQTSARQIPNTSLAFNHYKPQVKEVQFDPETTNPPATCEQLYTQHFNASLYRAVTTRNAQETVTDKYPALYSYNSHIQPPSPLPIYYGKVNNKDLDTRSQNIYRAGMLSHDRNIISDSKPNILQRSISEPCTSATFPDTISTSSYPTLMQPYVSLNLISMLLMYFKMTSYTLIEFLRQQMYQCNTQACIETIVSQLNALLSYVQTTKKPLFTVRSHLNTV